MVYYYEDWEYTTDGYAFPNQENNVKIITTIENIHPTSQLKTKNTNRMKIRRTNPKRKNKIFFRESINYNTINYNFNSIAIENLSMGNSGMEKRWSMQTKIYNSHCLIDNWRAHSSVWIEWLPAEQLVVGSNPSEPVIFKHYGEFGNIEIKWSNNQNNEKLYLQSISSSYRNGMLVTILAA